MTKNICTTKGCINEGKYCRLHLSPEEKKTKPISRMSAKRKKVHRKEYLPLVSEIIARDVVCRIKSPDCTVKPEGLHHLAGREGALLTDSRYLVAACNACNLYVELHPEWAAAHGWKVSKFSVKAKNQGRST